MNLDRERVLHCATIFVILILLTLGGFLIEHCVGVQTAGGISGDRTVVVIDAGHGGIDGGAVSCTGVKESDLNLQIALKLRDILNLLGIKTLMIRTEDISIYASGESIAAKKVSDLKERVRIINNTNNAVLISIHQNYFSDSRYSGTQVFYKDPYYELASLLQCNFTTINSQNHRKIKKAKGIYLLDHIQCPSVLIECGFLSNPKEEQLLRTDDYQKKICSVIGASISHYIHNTLTMTDMLDII